MRRAIELLHVRTISFTRRSDGYCARSASATEGRYPRVVKIFPSGTETPSQPVLKLLQSRRIRGACNLV